VPDTPHRGEVRGQAWQRRGQPIVVCAREALNCPLPGQEAAARLDGQDAVAQHVRSARHGRAYGRHVGMVRVDRSDRGRGGLVAAEADDRAPRKSSLASPVAMSITVTPSSPGCTPDLLIRSPMPAKAASLPYVVLSRAVQTARSR